MKGARRPNLWHFPLPAQQRGPPVMGLRHLVVATHRLKPCWATTGVAVPHMTRAYAALVGKTDHPAAGAARSHRGR